MMLFAILFSRLRKRIHEIEEENKVAIRWALKATYVMLISF
jgi:hypothetical protein